MQLAALWILQIFIWYTSNVWACLLFVCGAVECRRECKDLLKKASKHGISAIQLLSAALDAAQPPQASATHTDDTPDMHKRMVGAAVVWVLSHSLLTGLGLHIDLLQQVVSAYVVSLTVPHAAGQFIMLCSLQLSVINCSSNGSPL